MIYKKLALTLLCAILVIIVAVFYWPKREKVYLGYRTVAIGKEGQFSNVHIEIDNQTIGSNSEILIEPNKPIEISGEFSIANEEFVPSKVQAFMVYRQSRNGKKYSAGTEDVWAKSDIHYFDDQRERSNKRGFSVVLKIIPDPQDSYTEYLKMHTGPFIIIAAADDDQRFLVFEASAIFSE